MSGQSGAWPDRGGEEIHPQCSAGSDSLSSVNVGGERTAPLSQPVLGPVPAGASGGAEGRLGADCRTGRVCAWMCVRLDSAPPCLSTGDTWGHQALSVCTLDIHVIVFVFKREGWSACRHLRAEEEPPSALALAAAGDQ